MSSKTSSVSLTPYKSVGQQGVTRTPNNSPKEHSGSNRPLTKKEKKGLERMKYRERKKKKKSERDLNDFMNAVNFVGNNLRAIERITGGPKKAVCVENAEKESTEKEVAEKAVCAEKAEKDSTESEDALQDIANTQTGPMQYTGKEYAKINKIMKADRRRKKKAVENFNKQIQIIQGFRKKYPAFSEAYLRHKFGVPTEEEQDNNCNGCVESAKEQ